MSQVPTSCELDIYLATVRMWAMAPPTESETKLRSEWVSFLNRMADMVDEQ